MIILVCFILIVYKNAYVTILSGQTYSASTRAKTASYLINKNEFPVSVTKILYYTNNLNYDENYLKILENFDELSVKLDVVSMSVICVLENGKSVFVFDSDSNEPTNVLESHRYMLGHEVDKEDPFFEFLSLINSNKNFEQKLSGSNTERGFVGTWYEPVIIENSNIICWISVSISMEKLLYNYLNPEVFSISILSALFLLIGFALLLLVIYITISKPITSMSRHISRLVSKDKTKLEVTEILIKNNDEIGDLAKSCNYMMKNLESYISHIKEITTEKDQVAAELNIANEIQHSMLPCIFPAFPNLKEIDIYATMLPAKKIGGDFYDFFLVTKSKLAFVISDVSGKGISAALFMVISKTLIKNQLQTTYDPAEALFAINNQLCINNDLAMFTTSFIGILDLETGVINFSNAGHNSPLVKHNGKFEFLKTKKKFVLAAIPNLKYKSESIQLDPGDIIYLYTDGVTEALNPKKELFTEQRLRENLNKIDTEKSSLIDIINIIKKDVNEFTADNSQSDDITMLILRYYGSKN
ncbi:MAG: SpoIIE family protein phosphatase [Candidatus Improbicoccus devescovinae]|nr:MAG: SpoIIE family protein phosphatase [Candidatus Improbicoccus devescovinae]